MDYNQLHKDFQLNGKQFNSCEDLILYTRTISGSAANFLLDWFNDEEYIVVKTSGSTGTPKEIRLLKKHMINSALATGTYFNLPQKTTALLCLSTDFIAGKMMLVRAMVLGWHLDVVEPDSNPLNTIKKAYDFSAMVPLQVYNSLDKLSKIKKLIIGGGVVSKELEIKLQNIPTECYATYGMTETITHIAVKKLNHFNVIANKMKQSVELNRKITSAELIQPRNDAYQTLPDVRISKDKRGCLIINAPKVSEGQVITNDLVELISDTQFKWLGRYDTIINSGGVKLIPEQIEDKLSRLIDRRFFVAGILDEILGKKLILVIEQSEISNEKRNLIKFQISSLKSLHKYEQPKKIYFLPKFIETETKKIQRQKTLDLIFKT